MNWIAKLMYGRYGTDQLGFFMLISLFVLNLLWAATDWNIFYWISTVFCVICIWSIFSKNINRRYEENQKFLQITAPVRWWFSEKFSACRDLKTHCHFRCPSCKQKIRVPRGKGKIQITCPKCRHEFVKKT